MATGGEGRGETGLAGVYGMDGGGGGWPSPGVASRGMAGWGNVETAVSTPYTPCRVVLAGRHAETRKTGLQGVYGMESARNA